MTKFFKAVSFLILPLIFVTSCSKELDQEPLGIEPKLNQQIEIDFDEVVKFVEDGIDPPDEYANRSAHGDKWRTRIAKKLNVEIELKKQKYLAETGQSPEDFEQEFDLIYRYFEQNYVRNFFQSRHDWVRSAVMKCSGVEWVYRGSSYYDCQDYYLFSYMKYNPKKSWKNDSSLGGGGRDKITADERPTRLRRLKLKIYTLDRLIRYSDWYDNFGSSNRNYIFEFVTEDFITQKNTEIQQIKSNIQAMIDKGNTPDIAGERAVFSTWTIIRYAFNKDNECEPK